MLLETVRRTASSVGRFLASSPGREICSVRTVTRQSVPSVEWSVHYQPALPLLLHPGCPPHGPAARRPGSARSAPRRGKCGRNQAPGSLRGCRGLARRRRIQGRGTGRTGDTRYTSQPGKRKALQKASRAARTSRARTTLAGSSARDGQELATVLRRVQHLWEAKATLAVDLSPFAAISPRWSLWRLATLGGGCRTVPPAHTPRVHPSSPGRAPATPPPVPPPVPSEGGPRGPGPSPRGITGADHLHPHGHRALEGPHLATTPRVAGPRGPPTGPPAAPGPPEAQLGPQAAQGPPEALLDPQGRDTAVHEGGPGIQGQSPALPGPWRQDPLPWPRPPRKPPASPSPPSPSPPPPPPPTRNSLRSRSLPSPAPRLSPKTEKEARECSPPSDE